MNNEDYKEVLQLSEDLDSASPIAARVSRLPSVEERVTESLWDFMESVFQKTQADYEFKVEVQEELRARISEMDVNMLMALYNRLNEHEVDSQRTAMYPFVPKDGQSIVDSLRSSVKAPEERLSEEADHEVLQGLQQLNALMGALSSKKS